jgi:hypothetical protein
MFERISSAADLMPEDSVLNVTALCSDDSACGVCAGIRMILAEHDNATAYAKRLRGERDAARQQLEGAVEALEAIASGHERNNATGLIDTGRLSRADMMRLARAALGGQ